MHQWLKLLCFFIYLGWASFCYAQPQIDSQTIKKLGSVKQLDSIKNRINTLDSNSIFIKDSLLKKDSLVIIQEKSNNAGFVILQKHSLLNNQPALNKIASLKQFSINKDGLFYVIVCIVLVTALIKLLFPKHLINVFSIFFQTNYRQKQTKDQLIQDKLAHVGLMFVFYTATAVFVATLLNKFQVFKLGFWQLLLLCMLLFIVVYGLKYIFITILGVLFKQQEASTTYIFLVFLINKLIGIVLIPIVILISFSTPTIANIALTCSYIVLTILLLYRVFLTYKSVSNRLNINIFQFFLYFCGVEILPLLLIYKTTVLFGQ